MSEQYTNRQYVYPLFGDLPPSHKLLYTMMLLIMGCGYIFAMIQIYEVHAGRDGKPGLSVEDIKIAYSGSQADTRLEIALKGPMSSMLPEEERATIINWIHSGADRPGYDSTVAPILQTRCLACHDGSNPHIPNLDGFNNVSQVVQMDTGVSIGTLVRVSHIHLFGLTFIFGFLGLIFSHAYVRTPYVKSIMVLIPFIAIFMDIASWWLTKVSTAFSYTVVIGGALMGISFLYQWVVSIYQMWFFKCPPGEVCIPR